MSSDSSSRDASPPALLTWAVAAREWGRRWRGEAPEPGISWLLARASPRWKRPSGGDRSPAWVRACACMDINRAQGRRYRLVLRGELGEPFGFLFEGMQMDRVAGTTVLTGTVIDQTHLHGLLERVWELGLEVVSIGPADEGADDDRTSG